MSYTDMIRVGFIVRHKVTHRLLMTGAGGSTKVYAKEGIAKGALSNSWRGRNKDDYEIVPVYATPNGH